MDGLMMMFGWSLDELAEKLDDKADIGSCIH